MVAWTVYISFLGVLVLMFLPATFARAARAVALLAALASLACAVLALLDYNLDSGIVTVQKFRWIPDLGID